MEKWAWGWGVGVGFVETADFGLVIQGVLDRNRKFLPMKLSLRITYKKANTMSPSSRRQINIKPGSCPDKHHIIFPHPPPPSHSKWDTGHCLSPNLTQSIKNHTGMADQKMWDCGSIIYSWLREGNKQKIFGVRTHHERCRDFNIGSKFLETHGYFLHTFYHQQSYCMTCKQNPFWEVV